jgi:serine/threonine-protein kinase
MIGKVISHYKILERLGGGGMGIVYKAEDLKLNRIVALKFLPPDLSRDTESRKRFFHEAQAGSALQHNNICTIHEIDETDDGQMYICMDYYAGETLRKKIEQGPLKIEDAIEFTVQIAKGLASAHEVKEIHRDIKPANIMITDKAEVKIVDFGLARLLGQSRLTINGAIPGTIAYMSPEQARGEEVDHR